MEPEAFIRRWVQAGLATPEQVQGCSTADIREIEATLGVRLPTSYRDFLRAVGRNAGRFYEAGNMTYPDLLGNRQRADRFLNEDRCPFRLPTNAVVFLACPAGDFCYVRADPADADPPVFNDMGLDADPTPIAECFSAVVERALTRYEKPLGFMCCFCNQGIVVEGFDPCVRSD